MSIINNIYAVAKNNPHKIALFDNNTQVSYLELTTLIDEKINFLQLNNIKSLALINLNQLDWIITDLACLKLNILCLPIPHFFTQEQLNNALDKSGVEFILNANNLQKLSPKTKINELTQKITFTSGSTGNPKGVCLSVKNIENIVESLNQYLTNEDLKVHSSILPYPILLENIAGLYLSLYRGGCVDYSTISQFSGEQLYKKLAISKAESTILVPELLKQLLNYMQQSNQKLPDLKFAAVGGAKVSVDLLKQAEKLNLKVFQGYGLSENSSVLALNNSANNKLGSVGKILPHVKCHLAEDNELIIDNPQFIGYTDNNWQGEYPTGDIAEIDSDGYLYITGRKKNILITSMGRNISPEWPESILLENHNILQAIVYGDAEKNLKALIVTSNSLSNNELNNLQNTVNSKLPEYAQLADIKIVENFAKNNLLTGNMRPKREEILKFYNLTGE